jgi:hypothetical protein
MKKGVVDFSGGAGGTCVGNQAPRRSLIRVCWLAEGSAPGEEANVMRRVSRLLLLALVAAVIGFYPLLAPTPHRIDRAHWKLIQAGMTRADVEAIFGVPPGEYDWADKWWRYNTSVGSTGVVFIEPDVAPKPMTMGMWVSQDGTFVIVFDAKGRAAWASRVMGSRIVPPWQRWWKTICKR